ncbi:MAG: hypothetical protein ACJ8F3_07375 [Xanthobacteraceae bacterium]
MVSTREQRLEEKLMSAGTFLAVMITSTLLCGSAEACKGSNVLLEDKFEKADPAWDSDLNIAGGKARLTAARGEAWVVLYEATEFANIDYCADVTLPTDVDAESWGGLAFWAVDVDSYYAYWMDGTGALEVGRLRSGKWLTPVKKRRVPQIEVLPGSTHTMRVTLQGNMATLYLDDRKPVDFTGQPPRGESFIGVAAESPEDRKISWTFSRLKVTSFP